jgi:hypothetical protein
VGGIGILRWLIRSPEITQLPVDVAMGGVMKRSRIVDPFFVPAFNFVRYERGFRQADAVE